jgi:hypothetical protein
VLFTLPFNLIELDLDISYLAEAVQPKGLQELYLYTARRLIDNFLEHIISK